MSYCSKHFHTLNAFIMKLLDSIRKKPEHIRKRMLFASTGIISFIIFTLWWNTSSLAGTGQKDSHTIDRSPVSAIGAMWGGTKNDIAGSWNEMVNELEYSASQNGTSSNTTDADPNAVVYPEDVFKDRVYATTTDQATTTP